VKGFFNKILKINLKTKTFKGKTIPDSVYEIYDFFLTPSLGLNRIF